MCLMRETMWNRRLSTLVLFIAPMFDSSDMFGPQRKPMEKLLRLIGLWKVKRHALQIYADVLADAKLAAAGMGQAPDAAADAGKSLNFAFVGNPGTGKSGACDRMRGQPWHQ